MQSWEIIASLVAFITILIAAFIIHVWNWQHRWSIVESDSIRRTTTLVPASEIPALEVVQYEYVHGQKPVNAPLIVLLAPEAKYLRILDQYATGLCLAEIPVAILKWKRGRGEEEVNFANIAAKMETLLNLSQSGIYYLVYRTVVQDIIPRVSCAAKNTNNRWILISPEIADTGKWEVFSGNGANIYLMFSLNSPKRVGTGIEVLKTKLKIPNQNLAPFPIGGIDLRGQETVALGKIISWIVIRK